MPDTTCWFDGSAAQRKLARAKGEEQLKQLVTAPVNLSILKVNKSEKKKLLNQLFSSSAAQLRASLIAAKKSSKDSFRQISSRRQMFSRIRSSSARKNARQCVRNDRFTVTCLKKGVAKRNQKKNCLL
jgi:hypothetical protein